MGNQLRALEAGLAVARVLQRMLVVPDYMADNGEGEPPCHHKALGRVMPTSTVLRVRCCPVVLQGC